MDLDRLKPAEVSTVGKIIDLLGHAEARLDLERHVAVLEATRDIYIAEIARIREMERE